MGAPITVRYGDGTTKVVKAGHFRKWRKPKPVTKEQRAHWQRIRQRALARDGHSCVDCGRQAGDKDPRLKPGRRTRLEVHHLTYVRRWRERLEDVVTLCQRCHATRHQWARRERHARS